MNDTIDTLKHWLGTGSLNLFGLPFAGKNTQADRLIELFDAKLVASGDIFRAQKDNQQLQDIMATGANIPSEMFFEIMLPYFEKPEFDGRPLVLSEVGRKDGEQEIVLQATIDGGHPTKAVILLNLSEDEVWRRFDAAHHVGDRGLRRDDSDKNVLAHRLEKFRHEIMPVIEFYRANGLLVEVDGSQSPDEVTEEIVAALTHRNSQS